MTDEDRDIPRDPATCVPFVCELEPHDENVERLPFVYQPGLEKRYNGGDIQLYT